MNAVRPWLYIGKYSETLDLIGLQHIGIQAILHLVERVTHPNITVLYLPIEDGVPLAHDLLQQGIDFIKLAYQQQRCLLVACGAGISRSATFAIIALKEIEQCSLWDAYTQVKQQHLDTVPHMALWESLCTHYNEPIPYIKLIRYARIQSSMHKEHP
ncbi:dual specificity protein phosphatase family protein [Kovacikia minuta CCNUW1]|uniref:dual specificity protein phosphatase family protein n=1 Tax=Kovacikia minuta TaxID=2931930 RepID=UPI001CCD7CF0|nr:dual specificity protein phosphatase [Kovacikia minuta]UBF25498.1 dual specificity protein phosphatase family protein [Kovacikia minuta CCNUW1]